MGTRGKDKRTEWRRRGAPTIYRGGISRAESEKTVSKFQNCGFLGMRRLKQYALAASVAFEHFCRSYIFVPTVFFTSYMFSSLALRFLFLLSASICTRLCVIFA